MQMECAFSSFASNTYWKNLVVDITPGTKEGMSKAAYGIIIAADNNFINGAFVDAPYGIGIGSSLKSISNIVVENLEININISKNNISGIGDMHGHLGIKKLILDNIKVVSILNDFPPIRIRYSKDKNRCSNVEIRNVYFSLLSYLNGNNGILLADCEGVVVKNINYIYD